MSEIYHQINDIENILRELSTRVSCLGSYMENEIAKVETTKNVYINSLLARVAELEAERDKNAK